MKEYHRPVVNVDLQLTLGSINNCSFGGQEDGQWVKELPHKADNLSSIFRTLVKVGENHKFDL